MEPSTYKRIRRLVDGILECNVLNRPPIEIICDIMKSRNIKFKEKYYEDSNFCGVYMVKGDVQVIIVNTNQYEPRKNFTIGHELGHHFLDHSLNGESFLCDKNAVFGQNKPEIEKEADYFSACLLMPKKLVKAKQREFEKSLIQQTSLFNSQTLTHENKSMIKYLANYFKVSEEAMRYRVKELEKQN